MLTSLFEALGKDPYLLLFLVVGCAYAMGRVSIKGYGLGTTASAIIIGTIVSTVASTYGQQYRIDEFTKLLFYYLFMYAVGLRVGPSFINGLKGDGLKFAGLAVLCSVAGLLLAVWLAKLFQLPPGSAAGILAGAMTMSAALGSADQAVSTGSYLIPDGFTVDQISANIALAYGVTYVWGTVGIILIVKYLPKIFRVDARAAALQYEKDVGVPSSDDGELTAYQAFGARAYQLTNAATMGKTIGQLRKLYPTYRWLRVERADQLLDANDDLMLQANDVIVLMASLQELTSNMGLIGSEVANSRALNIPLDQASVLVTHKEFEKLSVNELRAEFGGAVQLIKLERDGQPVPMGLFAEGRPRRGDVLHVVGLSQAVQRLAELAGKVSRPSIATDLLVLSVGMMLGFLIGNLTVDIAGLPIGLGAAGGLLVSGVIVASLLSRYPILPPTPSSSRQLMEDLGLTVFVAIVGINVGATLLASLSGMTALYLLLAGFVVTTLPPILVWIVGQYFFKMNAAILMGATAGARSHSAPCREAAEEVDSTVPWIGFSVGYAVSGVLLTVFGYVAMII
jgi:putative transport protein